MSAIFLPLFYALRAEGVPVTTHNWSAFLRALAAGLHGNSLTGLYEVGRCLLVGSEVHYDGFDRAFAATFADVPEHALGSLAVLERWLTDPRAGSGAAVEPLRRVDLEALRRELEDRLRRQRERHDGGNRWIGTGGTSPFGTGGANPAGIRIGGGGGRSALFVADERRFAAYRKDLVLDVRQIAAALRRLRDMARDDGEDELDLEGTVDATARNCGDLEVVTRAERRNRMRVLLLLDVGGSMDPHADAVGRLFSAAHQAGTFRELRVLYFHNCPYARLYHDADFARATPTAEILRDLDPRFRLVVVGDAYMHPAELAIGSGDFWHADSGPSGLEWLARLAHKFPRAAWLNPEPERIWSAPSIAEIRRVFAMFPLTLAGLGDMVDALRKPSPPSRVLEVAALARGQR